MANPELIKIIAFINVFTLLFVGISLILGIFTRIATFLGIILLALYYFPGLSFPYAGYGILIDEHIIFIIILWFLRVSHAEKYYSLKSVFKR
jgi:thiosulfate dehydrogenase [quinone] large subunit